RSRRCPQQDEEHVRYRFAKIAGTARTAVCGRTTIGRNDQLRAPDQKSPIKTAFEQPAKRANRVLRQAMPAVFRVIAAWILAAMRPLAVSAAMPGLRVRSRLFIKYVTLLIALVSAALLASGGLEIWFFYREHKASLIRIQREQAEGAAA